MHYCPEIAVLQSALLLTNKKILVKGKAKTSKNDVRQCVSILYGAIQEICRGLEEDRDPQEEEAWSSQLFSILLYKVIVTQYRDAIPGEDEETKPGKLVDKMEALCSILPPVNHTLFMEMVKRCRWFQLYFDSLIWIQEQVARSLLHDTVSHICDDEIDSNDIVWGKLITDYFVGALITFPRTACIHKYKDEIKRSDSLKVDPVNMSTQSKGSNEMKMSSANGEICIEERSYVTSNPESYVNGVLTLTEIGHALKQIMMMDTQKVRNSEKEPGQKFTELDKQKIFSELCQLLLLSICFGSRSPTKFNQISDWMKSNVFGIDMKDGGQVQSLPSQAMGKYSCAAIQGREIGLNAALKDAPDSEFPWKCWVDKIRDILSSETFQNQVTGAEKNQLSQSTLSFCNFVPLVARGVNSGKTRTTFVSLGCCPTTFLRMIVQVLKDMAECSFGQNVIPATDECLAFTKDLDFIVGNLSEVLNVSNPDVDREVGFAKDWSLSAILWRIDNRQAGYTDGLLRLMTTFDADLWSNYSLLQTVRNNMAILLTPDVVVKFYELVARIADAMYPESLMQLKQLVLTGFSDLPLAVQDDHIAIVYSTYQHWPHHHGSQLDGIITATLNKLTMESTENEKVMTELCQLALQDVEAVIKGIVGRASSSAQQAEIGVKVLGRMSSVAAGRTEGCNLCGQLHQFLLSNQLSAKERRVILYFIQMTAMPQKSSDCEDIMRTTSLLNATEFIQTTTLSSLNVLSLSNQGHPMNALFALEIIIGIFEAMKHHEALLTNLVKSLATDSAPWLLCVAELWQYCVILWESDEDVGVRLKLKENLVQFHDLLKSVSASCELCTYGPETVWLHDHLEQMDWSVQLHMAEIISPTAYRQECELEDFCLALINNSGDSIYLNLLRAAAASEVMMQTVLHIVTQSDTSLSLVYEEMVVTLAQVLPHCVFEEWKRVIRLIQGLLDGRQLIIQNRIKDGWEKLDGKSEAVRQPLNLSRVLHNVITVLQFTTMATNMAALLHCTKCYVTVLKECVLVSKIALAASDHLFLLTKVFGHVCHATYWMPLETRDPLDVLLLDIVCSLELVNQELDMNVEGTTFTDSLKCIAQCSLSIQNPDTKCMIEKKITELLG
ncbi:uncharacterized protein LOC110451070 isoform X2 [Mizuhopecten yessoensis]|uniref:Gem-associated protein 4 n=1 Tax=Mizuhopecten yessoensis TaxID=6573 RepID=A0A210QMF4_MIZYE|nr:uncharacterized protein LOC110451070 isoform X2 [Mizuhopecten yessoensis]OWF49912.1 hypothetical protein KP79_PYT04002 [Mizuhopecten yessoensis]